ncbi:MAG TPA: TonB-dependent receptor [Cyclobacteriaceae bacterium]|nr:TonB-dependent receptor [Cyclobacteriaceae bacterium]
MKTCLKSAILIVLTMAFSSVLGQKGTIRGKIIDKETGEGLFGATAIIAGTTIGSAGDFDGNYSIENVDPGTYEVQFSFISYQTQKVTDVVVKPGEVTLIDITLSTDVQQLEEIVVTAQVIKDSESALMTVRRKSPNVMDGISAQSFRKIGDSNAASAIQRVPGVSVQGGKYVFVRGLGDRYSKSTLNNIDIPGLDPDRNSIQIDIFPTNIIDNMVVTKSFTADKLADFTGGVVDIETKDFPEQKQWVFSSNLGYNPSMHFKSDYITYEGGNTDFLGFDDGSRDLPISRETVIPSPVTRDPQLEQLTRSLNPTLSAMRKNSFMDYSLGISGGDQKRFTSFTLGYNLALNYQNTTTYYENAQLGAYAKSTNPDNLDLIPDRVQSGPLGSNQVLASALAGLALKTDKSKFKVNFIRLQNGESRASTYTRNTFIFGSNTIESTNLDYNESSITNLLLSGDHRIGSQSKFEINWRLSPTWSRIDDKDVRQTPYRVEGGVYTIEPSEAGDPIRIWRFLDETNYVGKLDLTQAYEFRGIEAKVKFGASETYKQRNFSIDQFRLGLRGASNFTLTGSPDELMSDDLLWNPTEGIGTFIRGNFEVSNTFEASQNIFGAYVSNEMNVSEKVKTILGLRAEQFDHRYTGQNQAYASGDVVNGIKYDNDNLLSSLNFFPSANVIYSFNSSMNLRLGFSRTIARPSFKEKSIAQIFDPITDRTFIGNIDLVETNISNFDLRWELFQERGQNISVSLFYKDFTNPIEQVSFAADPRSIQPRNVNDANVYGIELEARKSLTFISPSLKNFTVSTNVSFIESEVQMSDEEFTGRMSFVRTGETIDRKRQLQGQSPYLINAGLQFDNQNGWEAALTYNVQGERLSIVGINASSDVFDQPFNSLNVNVNRTLGGADGKIRLGIGAENILNDKIESFSKNFGSSDKVFSSLSPGTRLRLRFNYTF